MGGLFFCGDALARVEAWGKGSLEEGTGVDGCARGKGLMGYVDGYACVWLGVDAGMG